MRTLMWLALPLLLRAHGHHVLAQYGLDAAAYTPDAAADTSALAYTEQRPIQAARSRCWLCVSIVQIVTGQPPDCCYHVLWRSKNMAHQMRYSVRVDGCITGSFATLARARWFASIEAQKYPTSLVRVGFEACV